MRIDEKAAIVLGRVSTTTRGGVTGVADSDAGFMMFPALVED